MEGWKEETEGEENLTSILPGSRFYDATKNSGDDLPNAVRNYFDLNKVHSIVNAQGKTRVLTDDGLQHILDRHVTGYDLGDGFRQTSFWPMGKTVRPGLTTPNVMTQADMERLTTTCLKQALHP